MKKILSVILCAVILFCAVSCGKAEDAPDATNEKARSSSQEDSSTDSTDTSSTEPPSVTNINSSTVIDDKNITSSSGLVITGEKGGKTPTGYKPLPTVKYEIETDNADLSVQKISHSHGPASGGKAHPTVIEFQNTFDKYSALTLDRKNEGKILYLTFDCGYEYENLTSKVLDVLKEKNVSATFFCTLDHIKKETVLITRMIKEGHIVGNHSTTHPNFAEISREEMAKEIEQTENYLRQTFGYAAKYFRFPAGEYNESALELIQSLGYTSVFWSVAYDDWDVNNVKGKDYAVEKVTERLHDGAVILLHSVSKDNADALGEIIDKAREMGYEFRSLEQY